MHESLVPVFIVPTPIVPIDLLNVSGASTVCDPHLVALLLFKQKAPLARVPPAATAEQ